MGSRTECRLKRVVFEVTGYCNNACAHCYNFWWEGASRGRPRGSLSRERFRGWLDNILRDAPLSQIAFSGGEPLLCPDLPEMVGDAAEAGISAVVITNGALLDSSRARKYPQGTIFEITLFSTDARVHDAMAGRQVFERVLKAAVCVLRHQHRLAVACVVTRKNAGNVGKVIELAIALGADAVLLNRVNLMRRTLGVGKDLVPGADMLRDALDAAEDRAKQHAVSVAVSVPVPPCVVDFRRYEHIQFGFCPRGGPESYYTVGWNGEVRPCNHSSVVLGDLDQNGFGEIVTNCRARAFWRKSVPRECQTCTHPFKNQCLGGCPAAAHECTGRTGRIDPFVLIALGKTI